MTAILPFSAGMTVPAGPVTGRPAAAGATFSELLGPVSSAVADIRLHDTEAAAGFDAGLFLSAPAGAGRAPHAGTNGDYTPVPTGTALPTSFGPTATLPPCTAAKPETALPSEPEAPAACVMAGLRAPGGQGFSPSPLRQTAAVASSSQRPFVLAHCIGSVGETTETPTDFADPLEAVADRASPSSTRGAEQGADLQAQGEVVVVESENGLVISCAGLGAADIPIGHLQDIASRIFAEFSVTSATLAYRTSRIPIAIRQSGGKDADDSRQ